MFRVYDTAGQERYHSIVTSYFRHATVAMLCYDMSNLEESDLSYWYERATESVCRGLVLVGCKADLAPDAAPIEFKGLSATATSALSGIGIEAAFAAAYREHLRVSGSAVEELPTSADSQASEESPTPDRRSGCSC
jgi:GTPase SAR1 family protein